MYPECVLVNPFLLVNRVPILYYNYMELLFYLEILLFLCDGTWHIQTHQTQSNHSFISCSHESFSSAHGFQSFNVPTKGKTFIILFN